MNTKFNKGKVVAFGMAVVFSALMAISPAKAGYKVTMAEAEVVPLNGATVSRFVDSKKSEQQFFRFDVPTDIGNKWVVVSFTSYASDYFGVKLLDVDGIEISSEKTVYSDKSNAFYTKIVPSMDVLTNRIKLKPSGTYYIKVSEGYSNTSGDYNISIKTIDDDNWGGFDNETKLTANKKQSGEIEVENDVDSYSIVVSKKAECNFIINSDCDTKAYITDKDGIKLSETYIYKGKANNSLSAFGNGEKVFVRIQSENYTGKYTIKPCIASVNLKLTKYKRGTAVIKGKTRGYADVRVYYNEKYYDVTSNANGNFAINLDTKLKAKSKIEITVSKSGQDSIVKTFKVK